MPSLHHMQHCPALHFVTYNTGVSMGQCPSLQHVNMLTDPDRASEVALPFSLCSSHRTTVLALGDGRLEGCAWHIVGGRKKFPFLPGYRATCEVYGQECSLRVETSGTGNMHFTLLLESGAEYSGSSPSAPFAKLALALHRLDIVNGMEAFGFHSCHVQALLCAAAMAAGALDQPLNMPQTHIPAAETVTATHNMPVRQPDHNHGRSARDSGSLTDLQPALNDMLVALGHRRQRGQQSACHGNGLPSKGPTRQTYLDETHLGPGNPAWAWQQRQDHAHMQKTTAAPGFLTPAAARPEHWHPAGQQAQHAALDTPTMVAGTPSSREGCEITVLAMNDSQAQCMSAFGNAVWPSATKPTLPPLPAAAGHRPSSRAGQVDTDEALLQQLTSRPLSRARRRAAATAAAGGKSSGRGWTAFTAFGLEMRGVVRAEAPGASATEVEKLVGQRWARLPQEEKQRYVDLAARVRKQMNGDGPGVGAGNGGAHRPACSDQPQHPASYAAGHGCAPPGGGLKRSRSDAATAFMPQGGAGDPTAAGWGGAGAAAGGGDGLGALGLAALGTEEAPRPQRNLRPSRQYSTDLYATVDDLPWLQGGEEEHGAADDEADDYHTEQESLEDDDARAPASQGRRRRQRPQQAQQQIHRGWPVPYGQHGAPSGAAAPAVGVEDETMEEDVLGLLTSMRAQAMNSGPFPAGVPAAVQPAQFHPAPTSAPAKPSTEEGADDSSAQLPQHDMPRMAGLSVTAAAAGNAAAGSGRQEGMLHSKGTGLDIVAGGRGALRLATEATRLRRQQG